MIDTTRLAVLMDGGYVQKRLRKVFHAPPVADDIVKLSTAILAAPDLARLELFRIFFYDAPPYDRAEKHPMTGAKVDYGQSDVAKRQTAFLDALRLRRDFAVRSGRVAVVGWQVKEKALRHPQPVETITLSAKDLVPEFKQKEVDLKIGLDIAWISLKAIAGNICLVAGDSDFIPAMKFARREGVRVYLQPLGQKPLPQMKEHADVVLDPPAPFA